MSKFRKQSNAPIDSQIAKVLRAMDQVDPGSEPYPELVELLERLHMLKTEKGRKPVSWDTIAIVFGNLAGILVIVAYEQKHVLTSKGMLQLIRPNQPKIGPM